MKVKRTSHFVRGLAWTCAGVAALCTAAAAQDAPGLKVGEKALSFRLKDQDGKQHALDDLLKNGNVALVFFRSADW